MSLRLSALGLAMALLGGCSPRAIDRPALPVSPAARLMPTPMIMPGVSTPPVRPASTKLPDDLEVVGTQTAGKARAYSLKALSQMDRHVVNDVVAGTPVTVTYCDLTDRVRTFTEPGRQAALEFKQGGYADGLLLQVAGQFYHQDDGRPFGMGGAEPLANPSVPFERMTWKRWKEAHPDTDVYLGE